MKRYEKITEYGIGTSDQPYLYFIGKRPVVDRNFGRSDNAIWSIQSAGISLHTNGQKEPGFHPNTRTVYCFYSKIGSKPYQTHKSHSVINGSIDQHCSKNGAGRIFIKTIPWHKKRDELNYPVLMTGLVSKSLPRFTVFLSLIESVIIS
jgi:hypothetical protein